MICELFLCDILVESEFFWLLLISNKRNALISSLLLTQTSQYNPFPGISRHCPLAWMALIPFNNFLS